MHAPGSCEKNVRIWKTYQCAIFVRFFSQKMDESINELTLGCDAACELLYQPGNLTRTLDIGTSLSHCKLITNSLFEDIE